MVKIPQTTKSLGRKGVVVIGSGKSINSLSDAELEFINSFEIKIGINKYTAFFKSGRIVPSHIYFVDTFDESAFNFLNLIFKVTRREMLKGLHFILNKKLKNNLSFTTRNYFIHYLIASVKRYISRKAPYLLINNPKKRQKRFLLPKKSKVTYIETQPWMGKDNNWGKDIDEPLYHFRGSLSTVLNYISIKYPGYNIYFTGVDFDSDGYFFQKELEKISFKKDDWTTEIVQKNKKHFSIIPYEGTTIIDAFPYMLKELQKTNNKIFSLSESSYLVKNGIIPFINYKTILKNE